MDYYTADCIVVMESHTISKGFMLSRWVVFCVLADGLHRPIAVGSCEWSFDVISNQPVVLAQ